MASSKPPHAINRRRLLITFLKWTIAVTMVSLIYPLLRFTGFTVKPKPRHITISKKLQLGSYHADRDFILFILDDGPVAISRRCTHLGCRVIFRRELNIVECPCHQSQFSLQGVRLAGPAKDNLQIFNVSLLEDEQGKTTGYVVTI